MILHLSELEEAALAYFRADRERCRKWEKVKEVEKHLKHRDKRTSDEWYESHKRAEMANNHLLKIARQYYEGNDIDWLSEASV